MKYAIGDTAWYGTFDSEQTFIRCPDCGGSGRLRVTFHDETQVSIPCSNCAIGFEEPSGHVVMYARAPRAQCVTILGVSISQEGVKYRTDRSYEIAESALFDTKAEAFDAARVLAQEHDDEERRRIFTKEKGTRTWAWNASYHRRCIKEAQRLIEHHTKKLSAANLHARQETKG